MRTMMVLLYGIAGTALWATAPVLGPDDIGTSKRIPAVGQEVLYTVRLRAPEGETVRGEYVVTFDVDQYSVGRRPVSLNLKPGEVEEVLFSWTPTQDGWRDLKFRVLPQAGGAAAAEVKRTVPVTNRPLYFVWFGAPQRFKWCNVPTTVRPQEREWWLWHGGYPCGWKPGVCNKDWTQAQFAENYKESPWIAIDEVGSLDDLGKRIMEAVREHKQAHPDGLRAIWFMGAHEYWRDYADCVDLFVPEIYMNYFGNHLGKFVPYLRTTRATGVTDKMIPGLGINVILDENKQPRVTPTKADVLRQIRYLKTIAPELNGVGFFTSESAAPGVAEYGDELCCEYYIKPVLSLVGDSLQAKVRGNRLELSALVRNCGGMTAREVRVEVGSGRGEDFSPEGTVKLPAPLPAGEEVRVTGSTPLLRGIGEYGLCLPEHGGMTLLNGRLVTTAARGLPGTGMVLAQPPTETAASGVPLFAEAGSGSAAASVVSLDRTGRAGDAVAAAVVGEGPTRALTWVPRELPDGGPAYFQVSKGVLPTQPGMVRREGAILTISGKGCVVTLDTASDQITSLKAATEATELLGGPWRFNCTGWEGFGAATVSEEPAGVTITVPFANEQAEGLSRYFVYRDAPVVRIERVLRPKGDLTVTVSIEGAAMPQRGGVYALQGGVGAVVSRGQLNDSADYSDLLFGYLGETPNAYGADKAGWFDFAFTRDGGGGLGVAIERRWEAAKSEVGYDVTRYYDGADSLEVRNLWGSELNVATPQTQVIYLVVHEPVALDQPGVVAPAQRLWDNLHQRAQPVLTTP